MRKYLYAQMLLDILTAMKRPAHEVKTTARAGWRTVPKFQI